MHKYDAFIQKELTSHLSQGETIKVTGFLFTKPLSASVTSYGLSLMGDGYFFAALTGKQIFFIATEMGFASLKMINKGVNKIPFTDIKSIHSSGFLNQKMFVIELKNSNNLTFRLNSLATQYASGQKEFIESLMSFHQEVNL
ncbi:MAG: hypothetical protein U0Z26_01300 [Anaerolineales bacterium]